MTGYKDPPMHSRFKSGQSGNPKGRPKGVKKNNLYAAAKAILTLIEQERLIIHPRHGYTGEVMKAVADLAFAVKAVEG